MRFALLGNPNVGKSLIFSLLTGIGVEVSNYPGTTVDLAHGAVCYHRNRHEVIDLPGVYSLEGDSESEQSVREVLSRHGADVLVCVLDASHLARNLYLFLQVAEYAIPTIVVLNMMDEAESAGNAPDADSLASILGVPVIPAAAARGRGIERILPAALTSARVPTVRVKYDTHIEAAVRTLSSLHSVSRTESLRALTGKTDNQDLNESVTVIRAEIEEHHAMTAAHLIAANRHHMADQIAAEVTLPGKPAKYSRIDRVLTSPGSGTLILALILAASFLFVFLIGTIAEEAIVTLIDTMLVTPLHAAGLPPLLADISLSVILALQAGLGIAFPFIFTFFLIISLLEDSGYLTRAAFLADRAMHRVGLHGQAIVPVVLGLGCNVPAVMSIRHLATRRERVIAAFLVTLIPCSARTVVIAGVVAVFVGIPAALAVYLLVFIITALTGAFLSGVTPGEQFGMILEMAPLRRPDLVRALQKSWIRIREFLVIAMPLLVVSSIFLGLFQFYGVLSAFEVLIAPVSQALFGLPPYTMTALIFGILRKEMAPETLVVLAGTPDLLSVLSAVQILIFSVMSVVFIPCISTLAVLAREVGLKVTAAVAAYTLILGTAAGVLLHISCVFL